MGRHHLAAPRGQRTAATGQDLQGACLSRVQRRVARTVLRGAGRSNASRLPGGVRPSPRVARVGDPPPSVTMKRRSAVGRLMLSQLQNRPRARTRADGGQRGRMCLLVCATSCPPAGVHRLPLDVGHHASCGRDKGRSHLRSARCPAGRRRLCRRRLADRLRPTPPPASLKRHAAGAVRRTAHLRAVGRPEGPTGSGGRTSALRSTVAP